MKSNEKFYNMSIGQCCGFLLREPEMKKLSKILTRHHREVYEFLSQNINELEVSDWALAFPNGERTPFRYYSKNDDKKLRLESFRKNNFKPQYEPVVIIADNYGDAKEKYMEWWRSENEEVQVNGQD